MRAASFFGPLLLGLHHVFRGLGQEAGVLELGVELVQLGLVLLEGLGQAGLFLLQVHQLRQRHADAGGVGDDGDHALGGLLLVTAQAAGAGDGDLAGVPQPLEERDALW